MAIFLSNKGGSGRSTTAANVAAQLASAGYSVCLVDLDVRSATLGAVLGLPGMETGVEAGNVYRSGPSVGVLDVLGDVDHPLPAAAVLGARHDVWTAPGLRRPPRSGGLWLVPGNHADWRMAWADALAGRIGTMLTVLSGAHDLTIVDLRAGKDDLLSATVAATHAGAPVTVDRWLIFHRWTPQHVHGAGQLAEHLAAALGPERARDVTLVRTADAVSGTDGDRGQLAILSSRRLHRFPLLRPTIPYTSSLQRRETLITATGSPTDQAAVDAFRGLGAFLVDPRASGAAA